MFDGVLRLQIPDEAKIVVFAADIVVFMVTKHKKEVEHICNETIKNLLANGYHPLVYIWPNIRRRQL